jgi:hypothetical protein
MGCPTPSFPGGGGAAASRDAPTSAWASYIYVGGKADSHTPRVPGYRLKGRHRDPALDSGVCLTCGKAPEGPRRPGSGTLQSITENNRVEGLGVVARGGGAQIGQRRAVVWIDVPPQQTVRDALVAEGRRDAVRSRRHSGEGFAGRSSQGLD